SAWRILSAARCPLRCAAAYTAAMPPPPRRPSTVHLPLMTAPTRALGPASSPALEDFTRSATRRSPSALRPTPAPRAATRRNGGKTEQTSEPRWLLTKDIGPSEERTHCFGRRRCRQTDLGRSRHSPV